MAKELKKETSELLITVSADKDKWNSQQDESFKKLSSKLQIKGFRKGKVPADIAKKHISQDDIFTESLKKSLEVLSKEAYKEIKDEMVLDAPSYKVIKLTKSVLEIQFIYPIYPDFKLPDYKKLGIKYEQKKPTSKDIENDINKLREQKALMIKKENQVIAKGDIAKFDFEGSVDGKLFDGGSAKGYELSIGSGQFIPGFEDQMIGLKPGEEKDIKVTFPKEYNSENLKGKDAIFKVKIHEIKERKVPELNDDFAKASGIKNVKSVEELKSYFKNLKTEELRMFSRNEFVKKAFDKIKKAVSIPLPSQLVAKEMKSGIKQFSQQIAQQGMDMKKYLELTGMKEEQLMTQYRLQAETKLRDSLILAEIAKLEKINLSNTDYENEYKRLSKVYGQSEDAIKGMITKEQMQIPMTNDKVIDLLIKANK